MNSTTLPPRRQIRRRRRIARAFGWTGAAVAALMFAWLLLGFFTPLPDMLDVFGVQGIRTPAAVTIASLLAAAIGFHEAW